jgi:hypothetical protein
MTGHGDFIRQCRDESNIDHNVPLGWTHRYPPPISGPSVAKYFRLKKGLPSGNFQHQTEADSHDSVSKPTRFSEGPRCFNMPDIGREGFEEGTTNRARKFRTGPSGK